MNLFQLYQAGLHTLKKRPLMLFFPLLTLVIGFSFYWNLSQQYQAMQANTFTSLKAFQQKLLNTEIQLNSSLHSLQQFYSNANFDLDTFEYLIEAYTLTTAYQSLAYATLIKNQHHFIDAMHQKGFESCQIHHHILSPWQGEPTLNRSKDNLPPNQANQVLPISTIFPYTPEYTSHICEDLTPFIQNKLPFLQKQGTSIHSYTLFVHHKYKSRPILLQFSPLYLHGTLQGVITGKIDLQALLSNYKAENEARLSLLYLNRSIAYQNTLTHHNNLDITLSTIDLTLPLQFFGKPLILTYHAPWRLSQVNLFSLILSPLITSLVFILLFQLTRQLALRYDALSTYKKRLQQLLNNAHDAIVITNERGQIKNWSPGAEALFGYTFEQVKQQNIFSLLLISEQESAQETPFTEVLTEIQNHTHQPLVLKAQNTPPIQAKLSATPIELEEGREYFFEIHDITHEVKQAKRIEQLAFYDSLTGLENRTQFKENINTLLEQESDFRAAVLFLDLDGFKQVNDTLGHDAGDELLKIIALRLRGFIDHIDRYHHLCRFGGDEFIMFTPYDDLLTLKNLALRILKSLQRPIHITQGTISVSASIGIALYPKDGNCHDLLIRRADSAMYAAKKEGKNTFTFYTPQIEEQLNEHIKIEQALKTAIRNREFFLVYQPKINAKGYSLHSFEALIRWVHPELGFVPPDKFIAIAEESDLINDIGDWVIDTTLKQLQQWRQHPQLKNIPIAVNLNSKQIVTPNFFENLAEKISAFRLSTNLLELELTERSIMTNVESNIHHLNTMKALGFNLAIDDFGTGYSSLSYLKELPITTLKIDKSFIDGLPTDEHDKAITRTIINLSQTLNFHTVAEGVETMEQLSFLCEAGCQIIQGYLFSKPLKEEEIEDWLQQHQERIIDKMDICRGKGENNEC